MGPALAGMRGTGNYKYTIAVIGTLSTSPVKLARAAESDARHPLSNHQTARASDTNQEPSMAPKGKKRAAPSAPASEWAAVPDAASDSDVLKAVMEVQRFWIHGDTVC